MHWPELNFRRRIAATVWGRRLVGLLGLAIAAVSLAKGQPWWIIPTLAAGVPLHLALRAWESSLRRRFVREASLPSFLIGKLRAAYPQLSARDAELVLHGLRQFFMAHLRSGRRFVAMPSKVVDEAWHQYILHTQGYQRWCDGAFGRLLHHTPAEVLGRDARRNDGLRRSWFWACKEESIDPRKPSRLPLLFALDAKFTVAGGFVYQADCGSIARAEQSGAHCGTHFGDSASSSSCPGDAQGLGG
ncbi:MAG: hypothetical protein EOO29_23335, partial [Comamonadaceae bacterium]